MNLFYNNQIDIINNTIEDIKKIKKLIQKNYILNRKKTQNEWYENINLYNKYLIIILNNNT